MAQFVTSSDHLYSVVIELMVKGDAVLPVNIGHKLHATFFELIRQIDPNLNQQIHESNNELKPFTLSSLMDVKSQSSSLRFTNNQTCQLRLTLLDGGALWQKLCNYFIENSPLFLPLEAIQLQIVRMLTTSGLDNTGWASSTTWQTLVNTTPSTHIKLEFLSPTAFSMGKRDFNLFPEPKLVWGSLAAKWNKFAPVELKVNKALLGNFVENNVFPIDYDILTNTLYYVGAIQKGFIGTCGYIIKNNNYLANQVAALTEFARYSGVGYKTTMGMGQVRLVTTK